MAKVALLIGVSEYEPGLNPLPSAVKDVEAVYEVLLHPEMGRFAASDIKLLKNPERQIVEIAIETLFSGRHKDDLLLLYFSGHGIKDDRGRLYLATRNTSSQKVQEVQPAMKPEIYAIREGFKIRLTKVAPGDPRQRYRKEVARFIHRGDISFVGRRTLDVLRTRLELETTEAKAIEDEVLEPYRNDFREKLQQYHQVFTEVLEREETITDSDRHDLQNLQQILGLRNEDTMPIEALVTARFKTYQQNLQTYQQSFTTALRQEFPLSAASRDRLRQTQQQLELADRDIAAIESQITAEVEAYHQKLQNYQRLFSTATQQEYPLSEATRNDLRQQQQRLELTDVDVAPIEAQITTQIESYHQKFQQYEQAFVKATQRKHYPDEVTRKQLQQTWQTLELSEGDVSAIERRINAEIETYQANLRQYEHEFTEAVQQEYPLSAFNRSQLTQRHRALNLTAEDVTAIENLIVVAIEEHQQKLQQYIEIPGGSFNMGSPFVGENGRTQSEVPQHAVNVPAFFMGKFEVTQEQYQQIMGSNPSRFEGAKRPVDSVSWNYAVEFCRKLSQKTGREYRLPSEAEWEYACRAGTTTPFHFGETITTELANYNGNYTYASAPKGKYRQETTEVGSFSPNAFGLYDMHGNVWEWCKDIWHDNYKRAPTDASAWKSNDNPYKMLLRGGSWFDNPSYFPRPAATPLGRSATTSTAILVFVLSALLAKLFSSHLHFIFTLYPSFLYPF